MSWLVVRHNRVGKEMLRLAAPVRDAAESAIAVMHQNPRSADIVHESERGWGSRTMLVWERVYRGTTYGMAFEVDDRRRIVTVVKVGPHEGFYQDLARRAKQ